jgi:predicted metal-dependent HD superfamily phosphohydrolase
MDQLIAKSTEFISNLLITELPGSFLYHNLDHTIRVYKNTLELIDHSSVTDKEKKALLLASLFHDTGHIHGPDDHERNSVDIATKFLRENNAEEGLIELVSQLILCTKYDTAPKNELEYIIRDADTSHFAKDYFRESSELLRQDLKLQGKHVFNKRQWLDENIELMHSNHSYYTEFAKEHWTPLKEQNISKMMEEKKKLDLEKFDKKKEFKKYLKSKDPERAIQSVFRITLRNHIKLSDIADTKANILLSVNAIIISITLSTLIPKLDNPSNHHLIIPSIIFIFFTITSIILSVLATRPNVTSGKFTKEDVEKKKVNLLFFGNFHKMKLDDYEWAMNEMLSDKEYVYSSMTKDLYFLGAVLQKKYSLLRLTYNIFMIGILTSVMAFTIALILADKQSAILSLS